MTPEQNRLYVKRHYETHKQYYLDKNRRAKERKVKWLTELKSVACFDCGVLYPHYVMEFDHRADKVRNINPNNTWKQLREEVAKCDVVCANCHATRTWQRRNARVAER